jgi:hypothetical protein
LCANQGRFKEARPLLQKATELDPKATDARDMLEHVDAALARRR